MKPPVLRSLSALVLILGGGVAAVRNAGADGNIIDKIYHPYVQPLERELELRASLEAGSNGLTADRHTWRLGYGMSFNDRWFGEAYLVGRRGSMDSFRLSEYELEALWQATEQGEYAADWGMLFEASASDSPDVAELSSTVLAEKEWRRWTGTANLKASYEFGDDVTEEFDLALALQARYRLSLSLEPALEFYSGEQVLGAGPVLMGNHRFGQGRQLHWETGLILGLKDDTPDRTFRLMLEYEF